MPPPPPQPPPGADTEPGGSANGTSSPRASSWIAEHKDYLHSVDAARLIDHLVQRLVDRRPPKAEMRGFLIDLLADPAAQLPGDAPAPPAPRRASTDPAAQRVDRRMRRSMASTAAAPETPRHAAAANPIQRPGPRAVIVDTDCSPPGRGGGEEIISLLWMAAAQHQDALDLLAVTTCAGTSSASHAFAVARQTMLAAGLPQVTIAASLESRPVGRAELPSHALPQALAAMPGNDQAAVDAPSSAEVICRLLSQWPHEVTLICFGGQANLAAAEQRSPGVLRLAREVVCMGGIDAVEHAAHRLTLIPRHVAAPLSVAQVYCDRISAFAKPGEDIEQSELHRFVKDLCEAIQQQCLLPQRDQPLYTVATAVAALYPQLLTFRRRPVRLAQSLRHSEVAAAHLMWVADDINRTNVETAFVEDMQTLIETLPDNFPPGPFPRPKALPRPESPAEVRCDAAMTAAEPYPTPRPLLIDTDPGGDDVFALIWLAAGASQGLVRIVAVTTGEGNVASRTTYAAARRVMLATDLADVPVARGVEADTGVADDFHGSDGLGGLSEKLPPLDIPFNDAPLAPEVIIEQLTARPYEISVVCFGPLSNLAAAEERRPGVLRLAREIVCMGGAYEVPGNITPAAEFNVLHNPESFATALGVTDMVLLPLDVTTQLLLIGPMLDRIEAALDGGLDAVEQSKADSAGIRVRQPSYNVLKTGLSHSSNPREGTSPGSLPGSTISASLQPHAPVQDLRPKRPTVALPEKQAENNGWFGGAPSPRSREGRRLLFEFIKGVWEFQVMQTLNFKQCSGVPGMLVHDGACALYILHPELLTFRRCHTSVETGGVYSRGRTNFDHRLALGPAPNSWVGVAVDGDRAMHAFVDDVRFFLRHLGKDGPTQVSQSICADPSVSLGKISLRTAPQSAG